MKERKPKKITTSNTQESSPSVKIIHNNNEPSKHNVKKDIHNIALLVFLYMLQTIPLGLTGSLPYILSSKKISYAEQATFSLAFWPFSMKILWAPIVDAIYFKRMGKRKSWLVPLQYFIGFYMIFFSDYIKQLLDGKHFFTVIL